MKDETIPLRKDIPAEYKWDLTQLYKTDEEWEADLKKIPSLVKKFFIIQRKAVGKQQHFS